jgi:hypothetical protein
LDSSLTEKKFLPEVVVYPGVNSINPRQFSASNDALSDCSPIWASVYLSTIISDGRNPLLPLGSRSGRAAEGKDQLQQATAVESGMMHDQLGIRLLFEDLEAVVARCEAKRKGDQKAEGERGKGERVT